jgi:hypothetical protein
VTARNDEEGALKIAAWLEGETAARPNPKRAAASPGQFNVLRRG